MEISVRANKKILSLSQALLTLISFRSGNICQNLKYLQTKVENLDSGLKPRTGQ
jgi:hypothetical protein